MLMAIKLQGYPISWHVTDKKQIIVITQRKSLNFSSQIKIKTNTSWKIMLDRKRKHNHMVKKSCFREKWKIKLISGSLSGMYWLQVSGINLRY